MQKILVIYTRNLQELSDLARLQNLAYIFKKKKSQLSFQSNG